MSVDFWDSLLVLICLITLFNLWDAEWAARKPNWWWWRRLSLLRNSLNHFKITLSNTSLIQLRRLIGRKFEGSEWSLLGFGIGMTFMCFHLVGKMITSDNNWTKLVKNKRTLRERFFNKELLMASSPGAFPFLSPLTTVLIWGIGVETTTLQHWTACPKFISKRSNLGIIMRLGKPIFLSTFSWFSNLSIVRQIVSEFVAVVFIHYTNEMSSNLKYLHRNYLYFIIIFLIFSFLSVFEGTDWP
jgi:hypothetical protein